MTTAGVVGRDAELARLRAFLAAARGRFSFLSLEGEPGIGKTALWREAVREARAAGTRVLACRPSAAEAKLSWAGVADLLDEVAGPELDRLPEPQHEALEAALLRAPVRAERGRVLARGVASALLTLVRALAADAPLLLAVDDWQWLDGPSRRALQFTARRLDGEPIGLLSSLRLPSDEPPCDQWLDDSRVVRLHLSGLASPALARIAADRLGRPLGRSSLTRLQRVSGGNPLHALELVRLLDGRQDGTAGADLPVPEDLQALTEARVRRLAPAVREALLLAAVLSEPDASSPGLNGLSAQDSDGIVLVAAGGRIEFAHPLFAAAAYASLSPAERRRLHRRAAEVVSDPEGHARHLALATAGPDPEVAAELDHAAQLASVRGAPDAAAELSELAAERTAPGAPGARAARLVRAAALHLETGDLER
ncbi:MAG: AAA family ATPase, partial [Solirubrobacteraceae bacterium]